MSRKSSLPRAPGKVGQGQSDSSDLAVWERDGYNQRQALLDAKWESVCKKGRKDDLETEVLFAPSQTVRLIPRILSVVG